MFFIFTLVIALVAVAHALIDELNYYGDPEIAVVHPEMVKVIEEEKIEGFDEVTKARNGQHVTVTQYLDFKYLCLDVKEAQREICTTAIGYAKPNGSLVSMKIQLRVCSSERRMNCIVFEPNPENNIDFRNVFVYDNDGNAIDFDGTELIGPNLWAMKPKPLKLTGKVTVIEGQGRFIEPIEKIEAGE